ncbi:MAG: DNA repair protein RecO [Oscillospiraceae bacterium]|nr:DNA repair protein RecO [Oscillospiraceae bacterium]
MHTTIDGLTLSSRPFAGNRLLTILTAERGLIPAFANRASAPRSRLAASSEALVYARFVLFSHRGRTTVDKADVNRIFFGIREDYIKLCLASYFAQLSAELLTQDEPAGEPLRLMLNALHHLETGSRSPTLLKPLFELRLLTLTGFMPDLVGCRYCHEYEAEGFYFFPKEGDIACTSCCAVHTPMGGRPLSLGVLAAMRHIIYSPVERLFSFSLTGPAIDELDKISEHFLLFKAERSFPSLDLYKSSAI